MTRCWLALALLSVLILPQLFQRADSGHFAFVGPVSLGLLPWAVIRGTPPPLIRVAIPLLSAIVIGISVAGTFSDKRFEVRNDGRSFATGSAQNALQLQTVVRWLDRHVAPRRTLFAGPADLRWALYAPTELYFLTPRLEPAGFYLELGPGDDTPRFTTQLIEDLSRADVLVLDHVPLAYIRRQIWPEARSGSSAPNAMVARNFRAALEVGQYSIWVRRLPAGRSPGRPPRAD